MWGHNLSPLVEIGLTDLPKRVYPFVLDYEKRFVFVIPFSLLEKGVFLDFINLIHI